MSKHVPPPQGEPVALSAADLRLFVETEVERLLVVLDTLDGDPDLEPNLAGYAPGMDDREGDPADDRLAEDADDEPSLGFLEHHDYQQLLSSGAYAGSDLEDEHDGKEPSLGWTADEVLDGPILCPVNPRRIDFEEQCEDEGVLDSGIGDNDGLMEQVQGHGAGCGASGFATHVA
jgi:hypothetical protein